MVDVYGYILAVVVLTAAFWQYYKTQSYWLFGADLVCACGLAYSASWDSDEPENYLVQLVISMIVAGVMAFRFLNTESRLLPVVVFALSIVMFLRNALFLIISAVVRPFLDGLFPNIEI